PLGSGTGPSDPPSGPREPAAKLLEPARLAPEAADLGLEPADFSFEAGDLATRLGEFLHRRQVAMRLKILDGGNGSSQYVHEVGLFSEDVEAVDSVEPSGDVPRIEK